MNCNNVDEYVNFIIDNDLTQEQFLFLRLVYHRAKTSASRYREKFPSYDDSNTFLPESQMQDLIDKGFLVYDDDTGSHLLSKKWYSQYIDRISAFKELLDIFPKSFVDSNGRNVILRVSSDPMADLQKCANDYYKAINCSYKEHKEVLKDTIFAKKHDLIKGNLHQYWITQQNWLGAREIRLREEETTAETSASTTNIF